MGGVSGRLDLEENFLDHSLLIDQESGALNAHHFLAIHVFLFENAKRIRDLLVGVGKQRIGQIVFFFELLLGRRSVGGNA